MTWSERFSIELGIDEDGNAFEQIVWVGENGNVRKSPLTFVVDTFGPQVSDYETLILKAPTEGWRVTIERWRELGKIP